MAKHWTSNLLSEIEFASLAIYPTRAVGDMARKAKSAAFNVKNGDDRTLGFMVKRILESDFNFGDFLGTNRVLSPMPQSSVTSATTFWPSKRICEYLRRGGFGCAVAPLIRRTTRVQKSAFAKPGERPTPKHHFSTMECLPELLPSRSITLVDDIVTKGSTAIGAASVIAERFPDVEIRLFAVFRTVGFRSGEITSITEPVRSTIVYDAVTDRATRRDA